MRGNQVAAAILSLSSAILSASCQEGDGPVGEALGVPASAPVDANESARASMSIESGSMTQDEEIREAVGETAEAFGAVIHCRDDENSADCAERCGEAGIGCAPRRRHPHNPAAGMGELFACADVPHSCVYSYTNGDHCWFVTTLLFPVCRYVNGSP